MARKRFNTKFLIFGIIGVLLIAALGVEYKYKFRKRLLYGPPDKLVAQAKEAMAKGDYELAGKKLYDAATVGGADPYIYTLLGDVYDLQAGEDPTNNLGKARGFWESALSVDPRYLPALERIRDRAAEWCELMPAPNNYQFLRESAQRYLVVDPDDKRAQYLLHMSTAQLKRIGGQVEQEAVEQSYRGMEKIYAEDPANSEAMVQVAQNKLSAAQEAYRSNDDTTMRNLINEVVVMATQAEQAYPQDAAMQHRVAQVYLSLSGMERLTRGKDADTWKERARQAIARARDLSKPQEKRYREIQTLYAELLVNELKIAEAEQVYQDLLKLKPDEHAVRIRLADLMGRTPGRRDEAVRLLSQPMPPPEKQQGLEAVTVRYYEARALATLLDLQLDEFFTLKTPEERQKLLARLEANYNKLRTLQGGDRADVMYMQGRLQVCKGDVLGAVQTFSAALRSMDPQDPLRLRTMDFLARGYMMTGQTGQAKRTLTELIAAIERQMDDGEPRTVPHRLMLARLLVSENNPRDAKPHVDVLERHLKPNDPDLVLVKLGVMTEESEQAERKKLFDQLPQENRAQVLDKARVASSIMKDDDLALKLLEGLRAADPADVEVVANLAEFYVSKNKKEQAERVLSDALAKAPDNLQLQMMQKRLAADTPEEARAIQREAVDTITDPFRKELRLFELAVNQGQVEQARTHLANAEKLKPDDRAVLDLMYRFHASQKEFDKAQAYLERLAKIDPGAAEMERIHFALAKGDGNQALELAQKLTRDRSEFAISYLKLAEVQVALNRLPEAINSYRSALERDSRSLEALVGVIACYYRIGQPGEAQRHIETARRIYPNHARVREIALEHEMNYGNPEQVIAPRQEQLNNDKENANNWYALGQAYLAAYRAKATAGREAEAKAHLVKAEETFKQAYAKWPDSDQFATALAQIALRNQKVDEGTKVLRDLAARPAWKDRHEPTLLLAEFLMAAQQDAEAEKIYRSLLEQTKDVGLEIRLADLINRQNRVDDALAVLEMNAQHPAVRSKRIELLVRAGRTADAQKELDRMRATPLAAGATPEQARLNDAILHDLQASIYIAANRPTEAMDAVNKALSIEPKYAMPLYRRGLLRMNARGDLKGAIEDFSAVKALAPAMPDPRVQLARAYRQSDDTDAAMRELTAAVRELPGEKMVRLELVKLCAAAVPPRWGDAERTFREAREIPTLARDVDLLQEEARMWAARNDMQRAVRTIQEAAQVAPHDMNVVRTLLDILNKGKQYKEVLALTDRLIKSNPQIWWAYQARGVARCRMDDKDGALVEFEQGLKLAGEQGEETGVQSIIGHIAQELGTAAAMRRVEPKAQTDNRWKMVAAQLLRSQADYSGALRYAQQILADPKVTGRERANVMHLAGELYCNQSPPDITKAIETFRQLVDMNPNDIGALNNLAAVMTMPGSPASAQDALQYSQKAYDLMSAAGNSEAAILDTHGWNLVQVGRVEEGVLLLQAAIDRKPLPDSYFHLGDAYLKQSKPDDAETALRRARDLIAQAERDKEPVDPTLRARVEEALLRASALKQQKTSAAQ